MLLFCVRLDADRLHHSKQIPNGQSCCAVLTHGLRDGLNIISSFSGVE